MADILHLGGREFELHPLKLGQLRGLLDALDEMTGKSGGALIDAAAKVVSAGLAVDQFTAEAVLDLEATIVELNAAVAAVLRTAGLSPTENTPETTTGEAQPVASALGAPGISSALSTAPSPPAVPTPTGSSTA